ncbi:DUF302 domain-containing protein [Rhodoferax sp. 4810]|uniref:DUF302 domain-containing protein n=1 Tax=Thiospirillum jenense TaxID=1653858 RepID=A0A839HDP1_9GAMM|nr:DUF302 domain-containing protein [Thiospirillum jenense]MBB1075102.1 DUF302 domain-containing protein [Rhodoferax jenense]MBB1126751.1 DUF302 domain-containing protein [Thiospirillum jenense]
MNLTPLAIQFSTRRLLLTASLVLAPAIANANFTPFTQIATVPAVWTNGQVDAVATNTRAIEVAQAIAEFIAQTDESTLGLAASNWVVGGAPEGEAANDTAAIHAAILEIPTPQPIDPNQPVSTTNTKKVHIVEACNQAFASKALGVTPVIGDMIVANGYLHATALPCEIAVYADAYDIKIEMLNAEAIFSLFFTDVLFGQQMQNPEFAGALQQLPAQVNQELPAIVHHALTAANIGYWPENWSKGPWFKTDSPWDIVHAVLATPYNSPYIHLTYTRANGDATPFTNDDVANIANLITATLTVNGATGAGVHDAALDALLSTGSSWRAARPTPLSLPGNVKLIEACSPTYAKMAMSTGLHHATALPCEIAIAKTPDGSQLVVSYLDPHFMFNALFSDAFGNMSAEELTAFATLPGIVLNDLVAIVSYALDVKLPQYGLQLSRPTIAHYDMLPF